MGGAHTWRRRLDGGVQFQLSVSDPFETDVLSCEPQVLATQMLQCLLAFLVC